MIACVCEFVCQCIYVNVFGVIRVERMLNRYCNRLTDFLKAVMHTSRAEVVSSIQGPVSRVRWPGTTRSLIRGAVPGVNVTWFNVHKTGGGWSADRKRAYRGVWGIEVLFYMPVMGVMENHRLVE